MVRSQHSTTNTQRYSNNDTRTSKLHCSTVFQRWIVNLTRSVLWMLYWTCCCKVEIKTSNSQRLHKVNATTTNSQRYTNVASLFDSKFTSQHIMVVVSIQHCNNNVKFTTSLRRRYYYVAPTLHQFCEERKMWTLRCHMLTIPQPCLHFTRKCNNDMKFVWHAESILWH